MALASDQEALMTKSNLKSNKTEQIIRALQTKRGADISSLCQQTGWQAHSVRAALSRLRKAGRNIERLNSKKSGQPPRYRMTGADAPSAS
ncbi:DUF3489 domain-containing protein [Maricaulis maris]|uniref:DUF3489 domain-containing protein n=1 Tax=Maricaulis maris TaxID=74318 RepID=UPI003B8DF733